MQDYSTYLKEFYQEDLRYAQHLLTFFGSNYASATRLFSKNTREATTIFYSFLRYADELVDNPHQSFDKKEHENINDFVKDWELTIQEGPHNESCSVLRSAYWLFKKYDIPFEYSFDFLRAMIQDIDQERYSSYKELKAYMWGSASIVGHVMTFILGYTNPLAFQKAQALAEAMQLTNFLRDLDEDYQKRNRIYIPLNDVLAFGISEDHIKNREMSEELRNLIYHYVQRAEDLFQEGISGISYLKQGRFPVYFASIRYRSYLRMLKQRNYDVFGEPLRITSIKKITILLESIFRYLLKR